MRKFKNTLTPRRQIALVPSHILKGERVPERRAKKKEYIRRRSETRAAKYRRYLKSS